MQAGSTANFPPSTCKSCTFMDSTSLTVEPIHCMQYVDCLPVVYGNESTTSLTAQTVGIVVVHAGLCIPWSSFSRIIDIAFNSEAGNICPISHILDKFLFTLPVKVVQMNLFPTSKDCGNTVHQDKTNSMTCAAPCAHESYRNQDSKKRWNLGTESHKIISFMMVVISLFNSLILYSFKINIMLSCNSSLILMFITLLTCICVTNEMEQEMLHCGMV